MALQFKISLKNVRKPTVWRRVLVSENITFEDFHECIQCFFNWENCHCWCFSPKGWGSSPQIMVPDDDDLMEPDYDASNTKLSRIFMAEKQKYVYIYDFGDGWIHDIELEKITDEDVKEAVCLAGKGTCPPEDCGGPWGYEELKEILSDPSNEQYKDMVEWLSLRDGEIWDPNEKVTF